MTERGAKSPVQRVSRWAAISYWLPLVGWLALMFVMTSLPEPSRVLGPDLRVADWNAHAVGYFMLMLLAARLAIFHAGGFSMRPVLCALLACLVYAVIDELHQFPIPGRQFAWTDLLSDALGALGGMVVVTLVGRWRAGESAG